MAGTVAPGVPIQTYRTALEAKLANTQFIVTPYAEVVIRTCMEQIVGTSSLDTPTLTLFWKGVGRYISEIATPYFYSGDVCQLVAAGANALDDEYRLQAEDLPGRAGHFHYAHTFQTERNETENGPITTRLIGVTWATYGFGLDNIHVGPLEHAVNGATHLKRGKTISDDVGVAPDKAQGIVIVTWSLADEFKMRPYGLPLSMHCWVFGDTAAEVYDAQDALSENLAGIRNKIQYNRDWDECKLIAASMLFLQQTLVSVADGEIDRTQRKQMEREKRSVELIRPRVVALRKRKVLRPDGVEGDDLDEADEKQKREWTHRWVVEGFWRNQHYGPRNSLIKRIWIADFIKGPEDKPFKPKAVKIISVAR